MGIIFLILKIILIALLAVLSLLVLICMLIFFYPINYEIKVDKQDTLSVYAKGSWIFRIIRFRYIINPENSGLSLSVLWFKLIGDKKQDLEPTQTDSADPRDNNPNEDKETEDKKAEDKETEDKEIENKEAEDKEAQDKEAENKDTKINYKEKGMEPEGSGIKEKLDDTKNIFKDIIKRIIHYPSKKEIFDSTILLIRRLYPHLKPKRFNLRAEVGFDDPAITGYFLGGVYILKSLLMLKADVVGNFERKTINIYAYAKGRVVLLPILYLILKYIFKKPIWKLINDLKRKDVHDER